VSDLQVVTTSGATSGSSAPDDVAAMDPARVLRDPHACGALRDLVGRLRALGYDGSPHATASGETGPEGTLVALARGEVVSDRLVVEALGADAVAALHGSGALLRAEDEDAAALTAKIFPMRSIYTVLPHHQLDLDVVYLGHDSVALFEIVWAARGIGARAADLGTGNGFLAAALATRFEHVVAADLSHRCVATAALVPLLNPHLRGRYTAVQMDVSNGLRRGSFDLVTANAPWVPETEGPDGTAARRFAAGGPTGFELPRRFIDEAAALLAPGGRAFIACSDIGFADGRRPLVAHLDEVRRRGFEVTTVETRINAVNDFDAWAARKVPGATTARHLVVELRLPA